MAAQDQTQELMAALMGEFGCTEFQPVNDWAIHASGYFDFTHPNGGVIVRNGKIVEFGRFIAITPANGDRVTADGKDAKIVAVTFVKGSGKLRECYDGLVAICRGEKPLPAMLPFTPTDDD